MPPEQVSQVSDSAKSEFKARAAAASVETALLIVSMFLGHGALMILAAFGLLDFEKYPSAAFVAGPLSIAMAGLAYFQIAKQLHPQKVAGSFLQWVQNDEVSDERTALPILASLGVVLIGVFLATGGSTAIALTMESLGFEVAEQSQVIDIVSAGEWNTDVVLLGIAAVLLAPPAEEFLFRRLYFHRLGQHQPLWIAYLLSAGVFALIHGNVAGIAVYTWLGIVFAWALRRSGRLSCAILVHLGNNAITYLSLLYTHQLLTGPG